MNDAAQTLDVASGRPLRVRSQTSVLGTTLNCRTCRNRTAGLARKPGCSAVPRGQSKRDGVRAELRRLRLQHADLECFQNCSRAIAHTHLGQNV